MSIKDKLTKLKSRYSELLAETPANNKTWGDEFYDEESAQEGWQCAKTFMVTCVSQGAFKLASRFLSRNSTYSDVEDENGCRYGHSGFGHYVGRVRVDEDSEDHDW